MSENVSNNKRIAKNSVVLYFRMIVILFISLYTSRVVLSSLGIVDYGLYNVVGGVVAMFSFISASMGNSTQRFIVYALGKSNDKLLNSTYSSCIIIHIIIALIIVLFSETIGLWYLHNNMVIPEDRILACSWVFQFSIFTCVISIINVPLNAMIIAYERMSTFAYISILDCALKLLIVFLIQHNPIDRLIYYSLLLSLIGLLNFIIYRLYFKKHFSHLKFEFSIDKILFKKILSFASWSLIGNVAWIGYTQGLNLLLNLFFGPTVNAARGVAVQVQNSVAGFVSSFQTAINPQIVKSYANGNYQRFYTLIYASSRYSYYLLFFLVFPLILEIPYILSIWLIEVPEYSVPFVRLILIILLINPFSNPINQAIQAEGNIRKYQILEGFGLLTIVPISYLCLKYDMSPVVVFYVQLIVFILVQYIRLLVAKIQLNLDLYDYLTKALYRPILFTVLAITLPLYIYYKIDICLINMVLTICVSIFWSTISLLLVGIDKNERIILINKIKSFF